MAQQQRERNYIYNYKDYKVRSPDRETFEIFLRMKRLLKVWKNNGNIVLEGGIAFMNETK